MLIIVFLFSSFIHTANAQTSNDPDSAQFAAFPKGFIASPIIMKLDKGTKKITYFGTHHTNLPGDSLFISLDRELELLSPEVILYDATENPPVFASRDSTIIISGETGYIIRYAKKKGIEYKCIEPRDSLEYADLLSRFRKKEVVLFYLCRNIVNQQRREINNNVSEDEFNRRMNGFLEFMNRRGLPLSGQELTYLYWKEEFKKLLGHPLEWRTLDNTIHYPNQFKTVLNKVSRGSDSFRNKAMIEAIFQSLTKLNRVLVTVGWAHLLMQESTIRQKWDSM